MLNLTRLRIFQRVASLGSFSAAALALDYTQSTVSEQVGRLEDELGLTLLERATRPVRPTEAGRVLLRHAELILGQEAAARTELAALAGAAAGALRVGAFYSAWTTFMPRAIAAFATDHPGVRVEVRQSEPELSLRLLRSGELDLSVIYELDPNRTQKELHLERARLLRDDYVIVLPAAHPLARRRALALANLAQERWVAPSATGPSSGFRKMFEQCCHRAGFEPDVAFELEDIGVCESLVAAGQCIALMPALFVSRPRPQVAIRPLRDGPPGREIVAVWIPARRVAAIEPLVDALLLATRNP
jgi:DNA-binding transcriptional LysR family regulator